MARQIQGGAGHGHGTRHGEDKLRNALPAVRRPVYQLPRTGQLHRLPPRTESRLGTRGDGIQVRRSKLQARIHLVAQRKRDNGSPHRRPQGNDNLQRQHDIAAAGRDHRLGRQGDSIERHQRMARRTERQGAVHRPRHGDHNRRNRGEQGRSAADKRSRRGNDIPNDSHQLQEIQRHQRQRHADIQKHAARSREKPLRPAEAEALRPVQKPVRQSLPGPRQGPLCRPHDRLARGALQGAQRRASGGDILPVRPLSPHLHLAARHAAANAAGHLERQDAAVMGQQIYLQHQSRNELLAG